MKKETELLEDFVTNLQLLTPIKPTKKMATIKVTLDTRGKGTLFQIRLRVHHNNKNAYVGTKLYIERQFFDDHYELSLSPQVPNYAQIFTQLQDLYQRHLYVFANFKDRELTLQQLLNIAKESPNKKLSFTAHLHSYGINRTTESSKQTYAYTEQVVLRFLSATQQPLLLLFKDINYNFLQSLTAWMVSNEFSLNTQGIIIRNLKASYNDAVKKGIIKDEHPFKNFKTPQRKHQEKEVLTREQMYALINYSTTLTAVSKARDLLLISFYLCGANLKDIYSLTKIEQNSVVFQREKTKRFEPNPTKIYIEPELKALIQKYKGTGKYIFNFNKGKYDKNEEYYKAFQSNLNHRLVTLSKLLGFKVTFAIIRHTWTTLAHLTGADLNVISKSIGHTDNCVTAIYYVNYDWKFTQQANRKVIDFCKSKE